MAVRGIPITGVTPSISTEDVNLTIPQARDCIKDNFAIYHKLLDDKESELLAELELLEETNTPELNHVRSDLVRLRGVVDSLDESLGTNTLKLILNKQKSLCEEQIKEMERSELLLSHVTLKISDEHFVENLIKLTPYLSKAKFRTELAPLLDLGLNLKEDWYNVSNEWFTKFANSINLTDPQQNDTWEFPVKIPIQISCNTNDTKLVHFKAWDMLLTFNGLLYRPTPIKRQCYLNETTNKIEIPIQATKHKCTIGHNDGNNKFSIACEIETFPSETYEEILKKLSGFSTLFTILTPTIYTLDYTTTILCNTPKYTEYTVRGYGIPNRTLYGYCQNYVPAQNINSSVGIIVQQFLIIIPDSMGQTHFQVRKV